MKLRALLLCLSLLAAAPLTFAQDERSVTIDVPAPSSGYSDAHPAYLYFKKIEIKRKAKSMYEFTFTLQGDLPARYDRESGVRYKTYFDFQGIKADTVEKKVGNSFADDMIISIFHNGGGLKYETWTSALEIKNKVSDLTVTGLKVTKDTITFTARCPLFSEDIPTKVLFSSGLLKRTGKTQFNEDIGGGQDTKPAGLNEESNTAWVAATPPPKPAAPATSDPAKPGSLDSLLKP